MAYRRRQQSSSTVKVLSEVHNNGDLQQQQEEQNKIINLVKPQRPPSATIDAVDASNSSITTSSLVAKAVRASHANNDASISSTGVYSRPFPSSKDARPYEYESAKSSDESKHGFWGVLARKARAILDDDDDDGGGGDGVSQTFGTLGNARPSGVSRSVTEDKYHQYTPHGSRQRTDRPALKKGFNALTSSINYIGSAVEGGLNIVENRTVGLIKETRKHIRRKPGAFDTNQATDCSATLHQPRMTPQTQTDLELQLKASRDVAMAMAAKAKLLLRELKTVKADLAFAKERCAQLEDENKILRENRARGGHPEDDEMIRLQLESLLAEKARLAHENSVYTRENRFLREIVEYHQLTMQDVVYLDEKTEEVSEVYPIKGSSASNLQPHPTPSHPLPPS